MSLDVMKAREIAARIGSPPATKPEEARPSTSDTSSQSTFADALKRARGPQHDPVQPIKLSAHAEQRIQQREISLTRPERQALGQAIHQLDKKGSRDALLLRSDAAFVVNVPNRTVVTAVNQTELEDRIFTQIDSAMLV